MREVARPFLICPSLFLVCALCQKYPKKELSPNGKDCLWDSRTGFTVPSHLISYAGVVFCQTHIHNDTFKSPLYIVAVVGKEGAVHLCVVHLCGIHLCVIHLCVIHLPAYLFICHRVRIRVRADVRDGCVSVLGGGEVLWCVCCGVACVCRWGGCICVLYVW